MRDQIHTIPVLDSLRAPGHCPFCNMYDKLDRDAVAFMMGPAYMEDDVRMETNKLGFCASHIDKMYAEQNRLGLALMLHTFVQRLNKDADNIINSKIVPPRFGRDRSTPTSKLHSLLAKTGETCYLCQKIDNTFERYMDTFFYIWSSDADAVALVERVESYCLPHFTQMIKKAEERLGKSKAEKFLSVVVPAQQRCLTKLEKDLEWFTLKFDYRNADAPWKNAKDALPRAMAVLKGEIISDGQPENTNEK